MKKVYLFSLLLAGAMTLGSCSDAVSDLNGGDNSSTTSTGYVAFAINMPSNPTSRAAYSEDNDLLQDGLAKEYAVKNATLLLFNGSDESTATFLGAYDLPTTIWTDKNDNPNQITTESGKIVQEVSNPTGNCYALVVLNNNGVFNVNRNDATLMFGNDKFTGSYADFINKTASATTTATLTNDGFYMANAPLYSVKGGTSEPKEGTIKTLANITDHIYKTKAEAQKAEADQIFVERGMAKVTLSQTAPGTVDGSKVNFKIDGWAIDNCNPTTYLVRHTEGFSDWATLCSNSDAFGATTEKYRFVGNTEVASGAGYRTYFAKDMNYDTAVNNMISATAFSEKLGTDNPQYCFENTFDVAHQKDDQTTRILLKATLNDGNDFYIVNGDQSTIYTSEAIVKLFKAAYIDVLKTEIEACLVAGQEVNESNLTLKVTEEAGEVKISGTPTTTAKLKDDVTSLPAPTDAVYNALGSVKLYKNGVAYYYVRIQHFGDGLCPWNSSETPKADVGSIYPAGENQAANYLGRYGVLRNNWYDITVNKVVGFGSPTVPAVKSDEGNWDDELSAYVNVQINVLSWAKRTQSADLH